MANVNEIIAKYGGADLALRRLGELTVVPRELESAERDEMAALQAVDGELRGVVARAGGPPAGPLSADAAGKVRIDPINPAGLGRVDAELVAPQEAPIALPRLPQSVVADPAVQGEPAAPPKPRTLDPIAWWRARGGGRGLWERTCLAAAIRGWDPLGDDLPALEEVEYDAALAEADALVVACTKQAAGLPDSSAQRRVFVMAHEANLSAVVAYKPSPGEAARLLRLVRQADASDEQRESSAMFEFWSRVLWPPAPTPTRASPEYTRIQDHDPGGYAVGYPMAYLGAIGLRTQDVRGKR